MSLSKYTNIDDINNSNSGIGQFLEQEDLFVISQNVSENINFGNCETDVMEVTLYDINNNILPQLDNQSTRYIKYPNINDYIFSTKTNEIAINVEKILKESDYKNGIIKVNINFVKYKAGNETEYRKMWIQEISATRSEIRILPITVQNDSLTTLTNVVEFNNLQKLNTDKIVYKQHLQKISNINEQTALEFARNYINQKFSNITNAYEKFANVLYNDFAADTLDTSLQNPTIILDNFIKKIFFNFKQYASQQSININGCEYIQNDTINSLLYGKLVEIFNIDGSRLKQFENNLFSFNTANSIEQQSETAFETGLAVNTAARQASVSEYSTIDLTSLKLNTSNLDDFEKIQEKLKDLLKPTEQSRVEDTARTPTPPPTPIPQDIPVPLPPPAPTTDPLPVPTVIPEPVSTGGSFYRYQSDNNFTATTAEADTLKIGFTEIDPGNFFGGNNQSVDATISEVVGQTFQ